MEPIARPDGSLYRPRKVIAYFVVDGDEIPCGVIVLGTHRLDESIFGLAAALCRDWGRGAAAADPVPVWWRDSFVSGRRCWVDDPGHGRAGIWFREIVENQTAYAAASAPLVLHKPKETRPCR